MLVWPAEILLWKNNTRFPDQLCRSLWTSRFWFLIYWLIRSLSRDPTFITSRIFVMTVNLIHSRGPKGSGGGGSPGDMSYNGPYGSTFIKPQVYERVRFHWSIWKDRKICHFLVYKSQKGLTDVFYGCEKEEKTFSFVIFSYFNKGSSFTQLKRKRDTEF